MRWILLLPLLMAIAGSMVLCGIAAAEPPTTNDSLRKPTSRPLSLAEPTEEEREKVSRILSGLADQPGMDTIDLFSMRPSAQSLEAELRAMGTKAVAPLIEELTSPRFAHRYLAARELGPMRDRHAVQPLIDLLDDVDSRSLEGIDRADAAAALGDIGDTAALPALLRHLTDPEPLVRSTAVKSIAHLDSQNYVDKICELLLTDKSARVRMSCVDALEETPNPKAIPSLLKALHDDSMVADPAGVALAKLGRNDGVPQMIDRLKCLRGAPDSGRTLEVIRLLGSLADPRSREYLQKLRNDEREDSAVRVEAAKALSKLPPSTAPAGATSR